MMAKTGASRRDALTMDQVSNHLRSRIADQIERWKSEAAAGSQIEDHLTSLRAQMEDDNTPPAVKASLREAIASLERAQAEAIKPTLMTIAKGVVHLMNDLNIPVALRGEVPSEAAAAPAPPAQTYKGRGGNKRFILDYLRQSGNDAVPVGEIADAAEAAGLNKNSVQQAFTPMRKNGEIESAGRGLVRLPRS